MQAPQRSVIGSAFVSRLPSGNDRRWERGLQKLQDGDVRDVSCYLCRVEAKVLGTLDKRKDNRVPVYNVTVKFAPLGAGELRRIAQYASTTQSASPAALYSDLQEKLQLDVLPVNLADITDATCGCPDDTGQSYPNAPPRPESEPCKHIAAVLYKIADMCDVDGDVLFKLRGMDMSRHNKYSAPPVKRAPEPLETRDSVKKQRSGTASQPIKFDDTGRGTDGRGTESQPIEFPDSQDGSACGTPHTGRGTESQPIEFPDSQDGELPRSVWSCPSSASTCVMPHAGRGTESQPIEFPDSQE